MFLDHKVGFNGARFSKDLKNSKKCSSLIIIGLVQLPVQIFDLPKSQVMSTVHLTTINWHCLAEKQTKTRFFIVRLIFSYKI